MAPPSTPRDSLPDTDRFRLLGRPQWRHRLRAALGDRHVAWSVRRLAGWGDLLVAATRDGVCRISLGTGADVESFAGESPKAVRRDDALLAPFFEQLEAYLTSPAGAELDLPVDAAGTAFQRSVWAALLEIPTGTVRSYKDLAVALARPRAARAVGGACGANPVPFVVPCHRVVGSSGALTGFGLGVEVKERLLAAESGVRCLPL